jgi:pre-mRNA-splicing factor SYF1
MDDPVSVILLYERALLQLPGSYKLWLSYIRYRISLTDCLGDTRPLDALIRLFERSLVFLGKLPGVWEALLLFLVRFKKYAQVRRTLNLALRSLPVAQHGRLWRVWLELNPPAELKIRVLRRYLQVNGRIAS